eukprot:1159386-Pelagomonas_calceolata.AAC.4
MDGLLSTEIDFGLGGGLNQKYQRAPQEPGNTMWLCPKIITYTRCWTVRGKLEEVARQMSGRFSYDPWSTSMCAYLLFVERLALSVSKGGVQDVGLEIRQDHFTKMGSSGSCPPAWLASSDGQALHQKHIQGVRVGGGGPENRPTLARKW